MKTDLEKETSRIADEIVALVERTAGPVTLCRVHREVAGFGKSEPPYRSVYRGPLLFWADMSDVGAQALNNVTFGNRVAIQLVDVLPYLLEGGALKDENWAPIVLLPAKAANVSTKNGLFRLPEAFLTPAEMRPSWRVLTPGGVSGTVH
jgi:hypothetical protein